jgi:DNA (cytosine-5)-methyltransferase 1
VVARLHEPGRPLLVDLYSGEGGAVYGYWLAGFNVLCVDKRLVPQNPFPHVQMDALEFLATANLEGVAAFGASPPCQDRSRGTPVRNRSGATHPRLIGPTRLALEETGKPWVIENVPPNQRAEYLRPDLVLCGCQFDLDRIERKRHFETSWHAFDLRPGCRKHSGPTVSVLRHGARIERKASDGRQSHSEHVSKADAAKLMGITWMTQDGLGESIPPVYTQYVGGLLMDHLRERAA